MPKPETTRKGGVDAEPTPKNQVDVLRHRICRKGPHRLRGIRGQGQTGTSRFHRMLKVRDNIFKRDKLKFYDARQRNLVNQLLGSALQLIVGKKDLTLNRSYYIQMLGLESVSAGSCLNTSRQIGKTTAATAFDEIMRQCARKTGT